MSILVGDDVSLIAGDESYSDIHTFPEWITCRPQTDHPKASTYLLK